VTNCWKEVRMRKAKILTEIANPGIWQHFTWHPTGNAVDQPRDLSIFQKLKPVFHSIQSLELGNSHTYHGNMNVRQMENTAGLTEVSELDFVRIVRLLQVLWNLWMPQIVDSIHCPCTSPRQNRFPDELHFILSIEEIHKFQSIWSNLTILTKCRSQIWVQLPLLWLRLTISLPWYVSRRDKYKKCIERNIGLSCWDIEKFSIWSILISIRGEVKCCEMLNARYSILSIWGIHKFESIWSNLTILTKSSSETSLQLTAFSLCLPFMLPWYVCACYRYNKSVERNSGLSCWDLVESAGSSALDLTALLCSHFSLTFPRSELLPRTCQTYLLFINIL
jgi:hypothetical protein